MDLKKRDPTFDIMRGIGILLVVLGHAGFPFSGWIYLFHMPLFFMLSGWFFKPADSSAGLLHSLLNKIKTLWLPFVVANTIFTICNNLFLQLHILTGDERILEMPGNLVHSPVTLKDIVGRTVHWCLFDGGTQLGGALWFLQALFQISVLYAVLNFLFRRFLSEKAAFWAQTLLSAAFLAAGFACQQVNWSVWLLNVALTCYPLYHLGVLLRRFSALPRSHRTMAVLGTGSSAGLAVLQNFGGISLASNDYPGPVFLLLCSLLGWYTVYAAARFLGCLGGTKIFFAYAGRHSRIVLILHLLCFKPITWAGLCLIGGESYLLAAFPILFTEGYWWIPYTAAGLLLPLALQYLFDVFRARMVRFPCRTGHGV